MGCRSEWASIVDAALNAGWRRETLRGGHYRLTPPDRGKPAVVYSGTPSDWRAIMNLRADLRRSGLAI